MSSAEFSIDSAPDVVGEYLLRRILERADLAPWLQAMAEAAACLGEVSAETAYRERLARKHPATAGDVVDPKLVRLANHRLHELRGDEHTRDARALVSRWVMWREQFLCWTDPAFTVAAYTGAALHALAGSVRDALGMIRALDELVNGRREVGGGRPRDATALRLVERCRSAGIPLAEAARAVIQSGIEAPRGDDGADPAALLADRWRKVASRTK